MTVLAPVVVKTPEVSKFSSEDKSSRGTINADEYDILSIDEQIRNKLSAGISTLPQLQRDLTNLLWILHNSSDTLDQISAKSQTSILRRRISDIENGFDLAFYISRTSDLLSRYRTLASSTKPKSFMQTTPLDPKNIARKNSLIVEYLRIAKDYIDISSTMFRTAKMTCSGCYGSDFRATDDSSIFVCKSCGTVLEILDDSPTFKDTDRVNMSNRYTYTCRAHFIDAINCFEGKQHTDGLNDVQDILEDEMQKHNLKTTTVTKDHIYMFLNEKKLSDNYEDINLLYSRITNTPCPDITEYRNELLEIHEFLEEAYDAVKADDRTNALNVNFKLYKSLQLVDYPCKKDDFYFLKTPVKQGEHDEVWKDMIDYLMQKYPTATTIRGKKKWRWLRTL